MSSFLAGLTPSALVSAVNAQTTPGRCNEPAPGLGPIKGGIQPPADAILPIVADCVAPAADLESAWQTAIFDRLATSGGTKGGTWVEGVILDGVFEGWGYTAGAHIGVIDLSILPAGAGRVWVTVHISERP